MTITPQMVEAAAEALGRRGLCVTLANVREALEAAERATVEWAPAAEFSHPESHKSFSLGGLSVGPRIEQAPPASERPLGYFAALTPEKQRIFRQASAKVGARIDAFTARVAREIGEQVAAATERPCDTEAEG